MTTTGWPTWIQRQEKRTMPMKLLDIPHGRNPRSECNAGRGPGGAVLHTYIHMSCMWDCDPTLIFSQIITRYLVLVQG